MKMMIATTTLREKPESLEHETPLETNTNPTENTQQNPLQTRKTSNSKIPAEQVQNPSVKLKQNLSEVFSSEQTQAENGLLRK